MTPRVPLLSAALLAAAGALTFASVAAASTPPGDDDVDAAIAEMKQMMDDTTGADASGAPTDSGAAVDPADQARLDAAVAAFETVVADAGLVGDGDSTTNGDLLDLAPDDEDPEEAPLYECFSSVADLYGGDGVLLGQVAQATTQTFSPEPAPGASDDLAAADDTVQAAAILIDGDSSGDLTKITDLLSSDETAVCLDEALKANATADDAVATFEITASTLDIGDSAAALTLVGEFTVEGETIETNSTVAAVIAGDMLFSVEFQASSADADDDVISTGLEAMVDSLEG